METDFSFKYDVEIAESKRMLNKSKTLLIENNKKMKEMVLETIRVNTEMITKEIQEYNTNISKSVLKLKEITKRQKEIEHEMDNGLFSEQAKFYHNVRNIMTTKIKQLEPVIQTKIDILIQEELASMSFQRELKEEMIKRKASIYDSMYQYRENIKCTYYEFQDAHKQMLKDMRHPEVFANITENIILETENRKLFRENLKQKEIISTLKSTSSFESVSTNPKDNHKNLNEELQNSWTNDELWSAFGEEIDTLFNTIEPIIKQNPKKKKKPRSKKQKRRKVKRWIKYTLELPESKNEIIYHTDLNQANMEIITLKQKIREIHDEIGKEKERAEHMIHDEGNNWDSDDYYDFDSDEHDEKYEEALDFLREQYTTGIFTPKS